MALTLWCILIAIGSLWFFGLPPAEWLADQNDDRQERWMIAPFIGLAIIILVLQNLVYLDVRIGLSTPWLWVAGVAMWMWFARTGRLRALFSAIPRALLFAMLAIYLVQGIGLLVVGATYYVARGWIDEFNYTAIAQFLVDYPFSLSVDGIPNQPILIKAISLKWDRIGVMVFQGFLATSALTDSKTVFEPAILLAPVLTALAIYLLARRLMLSERQAAFAAVGAGLVPAVSVVHLETFFSQALGIPLLLILPLFVSDLIERFSWKRLLSASVILAAGTTIYTEFYLILVGASALLFGLAVVRHRRKLAGNLFSFSALISVALLLNPGSLTPLIEIAKRVSRPDLLAVIYPWAFAIEGLGRLWFGDVVFLTGNIFWLWMFGVFSVGLTLSAYLGLVLVCWRSKSPLTISILALAVLPLGLRIWGTQYPYQFYKLLLSISPLLVLGVAAFAREINLAYPKIELSDNWNRVSRIILVLVFAFGTVSTTIVGGIFPIGGRSAGAFRLLSPGARQAQDLLSNLQGQNILIACDDRLMNGWLAYFARHNRVWLSDPSMSDINIANAQRFDNLPDDILLLTSSSEQDWGDPALVLVWSAEPYRLWKIPSRDWVILLNIKNTNGVEVWAGQRAVWLGDGDTEIYLLSNREGRLTITGEFTRGPSLPDVRERQLGVVADRGFSTTMAITVEGLQSFSIPVVVGPNRIILRSLDKPSVTELPNGDARPLLLGIRGLRASLEGRNQ